MDIPKSPQNAVDTSALDNIYNKELKLWLNVPLMTEMMDDDRQGELFKRHFLLTVAASICAYSCGS